MRRVGWWRGTLLRDIRIRCAIRVIGAGSGGGRGLNDQQWRLASTNTDRKGMWRLRGQKEGSGIIHMGFMRSRTTELCSFTSAVISSCKRKVKLGTKQRLTPRTAGSSWTLRTGGVGSSTARSFTSEARKMIYWYGSATGGMNSFGGLQRSCTISHDPDR